MLAKCTSVAPRCENPFWFSDIKEPKRSLFDLPFSAKIMISVTFLQMRIKYPILCSPANPAQAGEEAVGLADLSGLPSSFCVLVGE